MSRGYLTADARSLQALAAISDYVTHLAPMSCWYRSDAKQDEFRLFQELYCEFQKYEVTNMSVVCGEPKRHADTSYKATKLTFLISDYY